MIVQRYHAATLSAGPLFSFFTQILLRANSFQPDGIGDQTDLISLPVVFIQALDCNTGEGRTIKTKINALPQRAIFDLALAAMFRFGVILSPASQAGLLLS
jgi:hypothetical protein